MTRHRVALLCAATLLLSCTPLLGGTEPAGAAGRRGPHCVSSPAPDRSRARALLNVVEKDRRDLKLRAVIARASRNGREAWTGAVGPSMTDVPARPDMRFRAGNVGIAFMGTVLLHLVDEGRVSLDDPLSRWMPEVPHSDEITLRMLADTTSGIRDYGTVPGFQKELNAQPSKQWSPQEILAVAKPDDQLYRPGTNWNYSHTNFLLLGEVLGRITHTRLDHLLEQRIYRPLALRATSNSYASGIPSPVLHAFAAQRGTYEESTFWNSSWTTAPGAVITMDICDLARAGIGSGQTVSERSYHTLLDPGEVGLGTPTKKCPACRPQTETTHFGLAVQVDHGAVVQNPSFSGYAAIMVYLPPQHLSIAVAATCTPHTDLSVQDLTTGIAKDLAQLLAPAQELG